MFLAMLVAAGFVVLAVSYATYVYSADHAGLIAGAGAGSWSAIVALFMPLFGHLFDVHRYPAAFTLAAAVPLIGYGLWMGLSVRKCT
jgi:ACS family hexuronate transporter-like MFS transporter